MIPLWKVARNRYTRRLYDAATSVGVTGSRMIEFVAETRKEGAESDAFSEGVSITAAPATDALVEDLALDFSIPIEFIEGEWVVVATVDGDGGEYPEAVGRALVSAGRRPYVETLGKQMSFDGAYVRKVYADRGWRGEGIAKSLVAEALAVAREEFGCEKAFALIAADNKPSQGVFRSNGFAPVRRHDYVRLFGFERRRVEELDDDV